MVMEGLRCMLCLPWGFGDCPSANRGHDHSSCLVRQVAQSGPSSIPTKGGMAAGEIVISQKKVVSECEL